MLGAEMYAYERNLHLILTRHSPVTSVLLRNAVELMLSASRNERGSEADGDSLGASVRTGEVKETVNVRFQVKKRTSALS
jgi:hypothetical protein